MSNVVTYLKFRKDLSFLRVPFQEVDAVAFSVVSYLDFTGVIDGCESIQSIAEKYRIRKLSENPDFEPNEREKCLFEMASGKRYRHVKMTDYMRDINEEEIKTSYGITYLLSPFRAIVAFPGTDTSLLSWKENFVYMYKFPAPGQLQCAKYLQNAMEQHRFSRFMVIGHSKGGLLATYATMSLGEKYQRRISRVYLFDAPGFVNEISEEAGYLRIKPKMESYVPVDSVVGRLFHSDYPNKRIVKSDAEHFMQHDMLSWQALPRGLDFATENSSFSDDSSAIFNELIDSVSEDRREMVINEMFDAFMSNGITNVDDINHLKLANAFKILARLPRLSAETKEVIKTILKEIHKQ